MSSVWRKRRLHVLVYMYNLCLTPRMTQPESGPALSSASLEGPEVGCELKLHRLTWLSLNVSAKKKKEERFQRKGMPSLLG